VSVGLDMEFGPVYSLRVSEVYKALETSPEGLSEEQVAARAGLYGQNLLSELEKTSHWTKLFGHVIHPFALLLWLAGMMAFIVREPASGLVIWALVLVNAGFSYWREYRTEQAMLALKNLLPKYSRLVRGGKEVSIPANEVVPGDVLVLAEGDNIPADARVVEAFGLRTNHATLTGEAVPVLRISDASLREGIGELERPNLLFAGTSIVSGTGRAVVYRIGMLTQFGRIAHLTQAVAEGPTPLQVELAQLTRRLSLVAVGIGALVFTVGAFDVGLDISKAFLFALGILVAVAPEGLPATITLSLAMAGQRLAQRGVLTKKLSVIETLGTVSVICTDKSGTLTKNQMTVRAVWVARQRLEVTGIGYEPVGALIPESGKGPGKSDLDALLIAADLCNNARLVAPSPERPEWSCLGDQTEAALRVVSLKGGLDEAKLAKLLPRIHELPFDARRKRMTTIHKIAGKNDRDKKDSAVLEQQAETAFVKGGPREVLHLCQTILIDGEVCPLTDEVREEILIALDDYARRSMRVLALARRELPHRSGAYTIEKVEQDLTFLGLMGMMDPPRPEVSEAVRICMQAGIRLVMITGDYGLTAESLARRIGMLVTYDPLIVTGADLDGMNDYELNAILQKEVIFARMAPEHKLRLVAAFQANGEVVAVTGDGVNDAPALRKADVGVSMGLTGTDVAKEAADVVITSDNFSEIVQAISEGRAVFENIRKFITYIFSSNVPEVLPFLFTALFNLPLALTVPQILAIDLGTDLLPGLGLGAEKPEPDVMLHPPRRRDQPLIDRRLLQRAFLWLGPIESALCYTGFFLVYALSGQLGGWTLPVFLGFLPVVPVSMAYSLSVTVFHAGVIAAQIGNAFACRSETNRGSRLGWFSNRLILSGIAVEIAIILMLIYFPPLARLFNHVYLPIPFWGWLILYAPVLYGVEWIRKFTVRKISHRSNLAPARSGKSA
jgi:Ca2+-transporting ATPase